MLYRFLFCQVFFLTLIESARYLRAENKQINKPSGTESEEVFGYMRKTALEIVSVALEELEKLKPTPEEIQIYADLNQDRPGVVTYSKSKGGDYYFLRLHKTWKKKSGGRVHIDIGCVDEKYVNERNVPDTTHLMLDKDFAPDFVNFVKKTRGLE